MQSPLGAVGGDFPLEKAWKSAVIVFGPARSRPSCAVFLSGRLLAVVPSYRYLGVVLTPSLRPMSPTFSPVAIGFLHKAPRWARSEGPPASSHFLLSTDVLPMRVRERGSLATALAVLRSWTSPSDDGTVLSVDGHQALRPLRSFVSSHSLTASACPLGEFGPSPQAPAFFSLSRRAHHAAENPANFGVGPRCSAVVTRRWLHRVVHRLLDRAGFIVSVAASPSSLVSVSTGAVRPYVLD